MAKFALPYGYAVCPTDIIPHRPANVNSYRKNFAPSSDSLARISEFTITRVYDLQNNFFVLLRCNSSTHTSNKRAT